MAIESLSPTVERVSQPLSTYFESDPLERATSRLNGLTALSTLLGCSLDSEHGPPTDLVWYPMFHFIGIVAEDIKRDIYQAQQGVKP